MQVNSTIYKRTATIFLAMALLVCMIPSSAFAATIQSEGSAPVSEGEFTPKEASGKYVESNNSFNDGNPKYYLVTHDDSKAGDTKVTYRGTEYDLAGVAVVPEDFNFNNLVVTETGGAKVKILAYNGPTNITVFFDDGRYNDTLGTNYTAYHRENTSYVGLKDVDVSAGETPAVKLSRSTNPAGYMERNILGKKNIYFENIIFDGKGINMAPKSRGEGLISINGGSVDGFVFKDIIIENVGSSTGSVWSSSNKNLALKFFNALGQMNFENVLIRNVKAQYGLSAVAIEEVEKVYFRNLTVDASASSSSAYPIKVETGSNHADAASALDDLGKQKVVFDGTLKTTAANNALNGVYVERYQYDSVVVPEGDWYVNWMTSNGGEYSPSFVIFPTYDQTQNGTSANSNNIAIHDLNDDYWIIDVDRFGGSDAGAQGEYITSELEAILKVMKYTEKNVPAPEYANDVANFYTDTPRAPRANIKLVTSGEIPSFKVPDGYAGIDTNIVAVDSYKDLYTSTDLVPVAKAAKIVFPKDNNIKLYNFDFHDKAKYTMHEAVDGVVPLTELKDPLDGKDVTDYPDYDTYGVAADPTVINSSVSSFVNCKFTVLAKALEITNAPQDELLKMGKTLDLDYDMTAAYTVNSRLAVSDIDDNAVMWVSSDPDIATVDNDGVVTPVSKGNVRIHLKATDSNNAGEIEKPFDSIPLRVVTTGSVDVQYEDTDGKILEGPTAIETDVETGKYYTTERKTFAGYKFLGMKKGSAPASGKITEGETHVIYVYEKINSSGDQDKPTPPGESSDKRIIKTGDDSALTNWFLIAGGSVLTLIAALRKRKQMRANR